MTGFKWFTALNSAEAVKKQYTALCKRYHPDVSGSDTTAQMQEINAEFPEALRYAQKHAGKSADNCGPVEDIAADIVAVLDKIMHLRGVDIELIGSWIWLSGNTYANRKEISAAGFRWSKTKKMWYWRREEQRGRMTRREMDIGEIRRTFGTQKINNRYRTQLA